MPVETHTDRQIVIGLGELLWDIFPTGRRAGGAPANFAFHVNQLGLQGIPASRVGRDDLGDELIKYLMAQGLTTELVQRDDNHSTGTVTVELDSGGHPSYVIHTGVAWDQLEATTALLKAAARSAAICFGTLGQRSPRAHEAIRETISHSGDDCLIVFDVNLRQAFFSRDVVEDSLRLADLVKLNDDEVTVLTSLLELPTEVNDLVGFGRGIIQRFGPSIVCITRGGEGACLVTDREAVNVPGRPIKVVDTVGAGDSFTAALVVALLQGRELPECGRIANAVGALVASRPGAMPPLREEFERLMEGKGL